MDYDDALMLLFIIPLVALGMVLFISIVWGGNDDT